MPKHEKPGIIWINFGYLRAEDFVCDWDFFNESKSSLTKNYEHAGSLCTLRDKEDEYRACCERINANGALWCVIADIILDGNVANLV